MATRNIVNHVENGGVIFSGVFSGPIVVSTSDATYADVFTDDQDEDE